MGRPRKPTATLKLQGTYRPDRHGPPEGEPRVEGELTQPVGLDDEAKWFWEKVVPILEKARIVGPLDEFCLTALGLHWANWRHEQTRYREGATNIYSVAAAWGAFERLASRFGLTPADRAKLAVEPKEETSDFMDLLRKGG